MCMCVAAGEVGDVIKVVSRDFSLQRVRGGKKCLHLELSKQTVQSISWRQFSGDSLSGRGKGRTEQMETVMQMQLKLQQFLLELWSWRDLQNHAKLKAWYWDFVPFHHLSLATARPWEGPYPWVRQFPAFDNSQ